MPITSSRRTIALAALLATAVAMPQPASAQSLFESLFGGPLPRYREFPPPPRPRAARPATRPQAAAARISAPSYYTYKADSLKRIVLGLATGAIPAAYTPGADFRSAAATAGEDTPYAERDIADTLTAWYEVRPEFLWIENGQPNERARTLQALFADAASEGLDPIDYAVSAPSADPAAALRFELALSARALRYVSDATRGRIIANRLSGYYDLPDRSLAFAPIMSNLAASHDPAAYLRSRQPASPEYLALKAELAKLRASTEQEITVDPAMKLKPGQAHPDFPNLLKLIDRKATDDYRAEFGPLLAAYASGEVYSPALAPAIKAAQKMAGLGADGVIGPRTVAAFSGVSVADKIAKVEVAMEQRRWLPADFGPRHVFVNQPAYTATYVEGGADKLSMRVVVGKPSNQTSFFTDEIEQVDYNPYWGVPQSIIVNEMLPRLRNDPGYLDRAGYEVTDAKGRRIPSAAIDWGAYGSKVPFNVRQAPSEANALGELKILFPNKNAIYMHDTPQKEFFSREVRALSHGCIRLQDPRGMAAAVLGTSIDHIVDKLARGHSSEKLTEKVPIYIAYFTAWPRRDGTVEYFADVYGRDARVLKAIETTESVRQAGS